MLPPGPAVAHPSHRLPQEVGGAPGGVGPALAQPGQQHLAGAGGNGQQRVIATSAGVAVVARPILGQSEGFADGGVQVDGQGRIAGSGPSRPGPGQQPAAHPVQLADMTPTEAAQKGSQKGSQGGWGLDHAADSAGRPAGAQHVGVVDAVAAGQGGGHQRHQLVAGFGPARGIAQVQALLYQLRQGQGRRKDQTGVGHQAVVVEGDTDAVGVIAW